MIRSRTNIEEDRVNLSSFCCAAKVRAARVLESPKHIPYFLRISRRPRYCSTKKGAEFKLCSSCFLKLLPQRYLDYFCHLYKRVLYLAGDVFYHALRDLFVLFLI